MVGSDRNDRPLVAQNDFRDPRRDHPDAVLAGADALDDRYVRIAHLLLDLVPELLPILRGLRH